MSVKWQLLYVPMLPVVFTFISFIGIAASSAGAKKYGVLDWDPMALVSNWENRACRFFAAFSFALAALGVNISANSLSAANDLMALFPSYVNIRRGQVICAFISWALVPWKILASAGNFLNFMSAYSIFLGPIAAIMACDFWIVHYRKYDCLALYQPNSIYRYWDGMNWRAILAFIVGVVPSLPGLINAVTPSISAGVGVHPYQFGWLLGFSSTAVLYVLFSKIFPAHETHVERAVLPDEIYEVNEQEPELIGEKNLPLRDEDAREGSVEAGKGGFRSWASRIL